MKRSRMNGLSGSPKSHVESAKQNFAKLIRSTEERKNDIANLAEEGACDQAFMRIRAAQALYTRGVTNYDEIQHHKSVSDEQDRELYKLQEEANKALRETSDHFQFLCVIGGAKFSGAPRRRRKK